MTAGGGESRDGTEAPNRAWKMINTDPICVLMSPRTNPAQYTSLLLFFLTTTHVCFFFILFVVLFGILNAFQIINSIKNTVADFFQKNFMIQGTIA